MRKSLATTGIVILNLLPLITLTIFFKLGTLLGFSVMPMVIGIAFANYFYFKKWYFVLLSTGILGVSYICGILMQIYLYAQHISNGNNPAYCDLLILFAIIFTTVIILIFTIVKYTNTSYISR